MIYVNLEKLDKLQGGLSDTAYAKELGVSRSQYWRVKHGNSAVGADFIEKFMVKYPELSVHDYFFAQTVPRIARQVEKNTSETDDAI